MQAAAYIARDASEADSAGLLWLQMDEPRLQYGLRDSSQTGSKRGWFGGKSKPVEEPNPWRNRTDEIAQRYRGANAGKTDAGSTANIELPYQSSERKAWN